MTSRSDNKPITELLLPNRDIPILLKCNSETPDGRVFFRGQDVNAGEKILKESCVYEAFRGRQHLKPQDIPKDFRERLLNLLAMNQAAQSQNRQLVNQLRKIGVAKGFYTTEMAKDPVRLFASMFNVGLHRSMFVTWMDDRREMLRTGLLCRNIQTAYFAKELLNLGTRPAGKYCLHCQRKLRGRQRNWCSNKCKSAINMPRYRKKLRRVTT